MKPAFFSLIILCFLATVVSAKGDDNETPNRERINKLSVETLENIRDDLSKLAGQFPALTGISTAKIIQDKALQEKPLYIDDSFGFQKNVSIRTIGPDVYGFSRQRPSAVIANPGGIILTVDILTQRTLMEFTDHFDLLPQIPQLELVYFVKENPEDLALEKAIRDIIAKNVSALKEALSQHKSKNNGEEGLNGHRSNGDEHRGDDKH